MRLLEAAELSNSAGVYMIAYLASSQLSIVACGWYTTRYQSFKPPTLLGLLMTISGLVFLTRLPDASNIIGLVGSLIWLGIGSGVVVDSLFVAALGASVLSLTADPQRLCRPR